MDTEQLQRFIDERVRDPLLGSFAVSFIITNWQFFYVLFAGDDKRTAHEVIASAKGTLGCGWLWVPIAASCFFTFAWPWLRVYIAQWRRKAHAAEVSAIQRADLHGTELTPKTLEKQPEYIDREIQINELLAQIKADFAAMHVLAADNAKRDGIHVVGAVELLEIEEDVSDWKFPLPLNRHPQAPDKKAARVTVWGGAVLCGIKAIGRHHVLAVPHGGLVPHDRFGAKWASFDPSTLALVQRQEVPSGPTSLTALPINTAWSVFRTV